MTARGRPQVEDDPEARIEMATRLKNDASGQLKAGNAELALELYSKALSVLEQDYLWVG